MADVNITSINTLSREDNQLYVEYDISPTFGFVTDPNDISKILPANFEEYQPIVDNLTNTDGLYFRSLVDGLQHNFPQHNYLTLANNLTTNQKKQIYSLFTFIAQKYIRCMGVPREGVRQITEIPYEIGLIWHECAKEFDLPCVTSYAAVVLYNCDKIDNTTVGSSHAISGTNDELHFYKVHIELEMYGAEILAKMYWFDFSNLEAAKELLIDVTNVIKKVTKTMKTMYDGCDPDVFWSVVRLYLGGYTESNGLPNGLGVTGTNLRFNFGGGSAAQSTLIQAIDVVLGIKHDSPHGAKFLRDQRNYMPLKHRKFLQALEIIYADQQLKEYVLLANRDDIISAYNTAVDALKNFRMAHYTIVHKYIVQHIEKQTITNTLDEDNLHGSGGTGGSPIEQLEDYIEDTRNSTLEVAQTATIDDSAITENENLQSSFLFHEDLWLKSSIAFKCIAAVTICIYCIMFFSS